MTPEELNKARHSSAHMLNATIAKMHPGTKMAIGPTIDNGFYQDFELPENVTISETDLPKIQKWLKKMIQEKHDFVGREVTAEEARAAFEGQAYKLEMIDELEAEGTQITLYESGPLLDLCRGGHTDNTSEIPLDGLMLHKVSGAYWKGDEKNTMLTRIYGLLFPTKQELDEYLELLEEAKRRDHRKLGKDLDLFFFSDKVGKGLPLLTDRGATIRRELERAVIDEELKRGYKHVKTPDLASLELYKTSGHYPFYKDSMYAPIDIDGDKFMLRPMTCPHHFEIYAQRPRSYRELPLRIAELATLYRYEQSGELSGLLRVRSFTLSDSHIFVTEEQAKDEIKKVIDLIEYFAGTFGLEKGLDKDYSYRLSLGDRNDEEKYFKDDKKWDQGEAVLREVLEEIDAPYVEAEKEAAFYGPKIDVQMKNVMGKEETAFTVQYDFCLPHRFKVRYTAEDGSEKQPVVIHRSSVGAIERTMAFLIEHFAGEFPLWLSPTHVDILSVSEKHVDFCEKLAQEFRDVGIRVDIDDSDETVGKKIRNATKRKSPYILVIGDKEMGSDMLAVRKRGEQDTVDISKEQFKKDILERISTKSLDI